MAGWDGGLTPKPVISTVTSFRVASAPPVDPIVAATVMCLVVSSAPSVDLDRSRGYGDAQKPTTAATATGLGIVNTRGCDGGKGQSRGATEQRNGK